MIDFKKFVSLAALAAMIVLFPFPAPAQEVPLEPEFTGLVSIAVNSVAKGDFEVGIYQDEPIIALGMLVELLSENLKPEVYDTIFNVVLARLEWITRDDLALVGIGWDWDMSRIMLALTIPPSYLPVIDLDAAPQYPLNIKPILKPGAISGHIDFDALATAEISALGTTVPAELNLSGVVNILDWVAVSSGRLSVDEAVFSGELSEAKLLRDFPGINGRLSLGRVASPGLLYQSQPELYGFSLESEEIVKYKVKPGFKDVFAEFTLEKTSTVRIILNDEVYKTFPLNPGNYRLLDIPFTYGLNDFILEIDDGEGNVTRRQSIIPREMNLLAEGISDYSISAGVGKAEVDQPFLSGYYRYGFESRLTAGLALQADLRSALAGISFIYASPVGNWTGTGVTVAAWDGRTNPWSAAASLQYRIALPGKEQIPSFALAAEFVSEGFASPSPLASVSQDSQTLRLNGQLGGKLSPTTSYNLSVNWAKIFGTVDTESTKLNLSINQSLGSGTSMSVIANLTLPRGGDPVFNATFMLFVLPKEKAGRSLSFVQSGDGPSSISFVDTLDVLGGINLSARARNPLIGSELGSSLGLTGKKTTNIGDISLSADYDYGAVVSSTAGRIRASMSTTLAFVDRYVALTRNIQDSFVLFVPSKEIRGQQVQVSIEGAGKATSPEGRPVILPIAAYKPTAAYMDLPESPPDMLPRIQAALLVPTYRSGIAYVTDIQRRYKVTGTLLNAEGVPYEYIAGDLVDISGTNLTSTFTDDTGYFELYDLDPGTYEIRWPDFVGTTSFQIEENPEAEINLGLIPAKPLLTP